MSIGSSLEEVTVQALGRRLTAFIFGSETPDGASVERMTSMLVERPPHPIPSVNDWRRLLATVLFADRQGDLGRVS